MGVREEAEPGEMPSSGTGVRGKRKEGGPLRWNTSYGGHEIPALGHGVSWTSTRQAEAEANGP